MSRASEKLLRDRTSVSPEQSEDHQSERLFFRRQKGVLRDIRHNVSEDIDQYSDSRSRREKFSSGAQENRKSVREMFMERAASAQSGSDRAVSAMSTNDGTGGYSNRGAAMDDNSNRGTSAGGYSNRGTSARSFTSSVSFGMLGPGTREGSEMSTPSGHVDRMLADLKQFYGKSVRRRLVFIAIFHDEIRFCILLMLQC